MTNHTDPTDEVDVDTVANRAAQVITTMGAEIRALKSERDRFRSAWRNARERAQAYGEGILRIVSEREQYQEWLRQAEDRAAASAVRVPATDRTALRELIAEALVGWAYRGKAPKDGGILETVRANAYSRADAVLAVLPEPADRAAVLREAAGSAAVVSGWTADETQTETCDVDPVYDPRAWETYRRDAGCGCTAPAPIDRAVHRDHSLCGVSPCSDCR